MAIKSRPRGNSLNGNSRRGARRDAGKQRYWGDVLRRQAASGLSVAEFCRREGLSQPSFYAWRRTIAQRSHTGAKPRGRRGAFDFVPVRLREVARQDAVVGDTRQALRGTVGLSLELGSGLVLRLPDTISAQRLAEFVSALESQRR